MTRMLFAGLATLALLGSAQVSPASASIAADQVGSHRCDASASARVIKGTSRWRDPNTLTPKEAAALDTRSGRILDDSGTRTAPRPNGSVTIRVHFHGVTNRDGDGLVSKDRFQDQIRVLNQAYGGRTAPSAADTPFRFRIASIDRTKRNVWYNASAFTPQGNERLREMRRALHVGDARDLNLYTIGPKFGLLGFATFPGSYGKFPRLDGSVLLNASLPGGNANFGPGAVYNRGDTATHEIGHWLNLYHTFQGSCSRLNDYVTDTHRQKADNNIFICNPKLDTCKPHGRNQRDPVKNFMNYVDDPCMNQFTRGQRERMENGWFIRRALSS